MLGSGGWWLQASGKSGNPRRSEWVFHVEVGEGLGAASREDAGHLALEGPSVLSQASVLGLVSAVHAHQGLRVLHGCFPSVRARNPHQTSPLSELTPEQLTRREAASRPLQL